MRAHVFFHLVLVTVLMSDTSTQGGVSGARQGTGDADRQQLKEFNDETIQTLQSLNQSLFKTNQRYNQSIIVMEKIAETQERMDKTLDRMATALEEFLKIRRLEKSKDDVESKPKKKSGEKKRSKTKGKKSGEKKRSKTKGKKSRGKKRSKKKDKKLIFKAMIKKITGTQNQMPERINQIAKIAARIMPLLETLAALSCRPPWTLISGSRCILITNFLTSRPDGEAVCKSVGGKIFAFEDEDDVKAVKNVSHHYKVAFFVGHGYKDGQWKSTDGPSAYNPPESLYQPGASLSGACAYVKSPGDLVTGGCYFALRTLCRRVHALPKPLIFPWQDRPYFLLS